MVYFMYHPDWAMWAQIKHYLGVFLGIILAFKLVDSVSKVDYHSQSARL
jgi:hypothetical protein